MDSLLKSFNPKRASFGRHETFTLRYSWLTKGFQAFEKNNDIFSKDEATIELGVGKNMVNAIKYWLRASSMLIDTENGLTVSRIGYELLSEEGWDPYLEDETTLWLINWLISTNFELATAWYWFFNCFHKTDFTSEEAAELLADFMRNKLTGKHSEKTVKQEIAIILRMYCPQKSSNNVQAEENLDAPLAALKLISPIESSRRFRSISSTQPGIPVELIGFAVNEILNQRQVDNILISDLMYGESLGIAVGSSFRLSESGLMAKLENLVNSYPNLFQINETAGINQFYRTGSNTDSLQFLRNYYQPSKSRMTA